MGGKFILETDHANLKWLCSIAPHKAKLARWASSLAEYDFELRHRPGRSNTVPYALSRYPVTQFITSENSVPSATFVDILPPVDVSAYLVTALGLTPYYVVPLTPTISSSFTTAFALTTADTSTSPPTKVEHLSTTSQTEEPLTLLGSNRQDFITLQLQDPTLKLIHKYLSAGSKKSALHDSSSREQTRIQNLARRCLILEGLVMYSDEFLDDPGHLRIFVPDN